MVNLKQLNEQIEEAKMKKDKESIDAQIEVYEGQSYEARQSYTEAKASRSKSRSKLPKDVPDDSAYKERLLEAQYIKMKVFSQEQSDQVDEYTAEIKKQQKAKETTQVFDKQIPQLYTSAVQEVETTKSAVTKAKEDVEVKYDAVINTAQEAHTKETTRRGEQWKQVEHDYVLTVSKNQWTPDKVPAYDKRHTYDQGRLVWGYEQKSKKYLKDAQEAKIDSEMSLRFEHMTADGFQFAKVGAVSKEGSKLLTDIVVHGKDHGRSVPAQDRHYVELIMARSSLLKGEISEAQYHNMTSVSTTKKQAEDKKQAEARSALARAKSHGQLSADSKKWAKVASNPYTSNPNAQPVTNKSGSGTSSDPFRYNTNAGGTGIGTTVVPKDKLAYYMQNFQTSSNSLNNNTLKNTSFSNKGTDVTNQSLQQIAKQRETELANRQQQQYTQELRAGNIGLADALLNPQTTQSYTGTNTVNLKTFLKERGHDLSKPESIPDSVLMNPQKYNKAREVASESAKLNTTMGDLRFNEPYYAGLSTETGFKYKYPEATALVQQQRKEAKQRIAKFDPMLQQAQGKMITTGTMTTATNKPMVKSSAFNPYNPTGMPTGQSWVVTTYEKTKVPTISGGVVEVNAPVENLFETKKGADAFAKHENIKLAKEQRVFSGTSNVMWNKFNYANAVDSGELPHPRTTPTLLDDLAYYSNVVNRPLITLGATVTNLGLSQDKQIPVREVASGHLIGGTIKDVIGLDPLKGSGVSSAYEYAKEDPLRTALELPAEALVWVTGGKAIQLGAKGFVAGKTALSQANYIPQVVKTVGTKIESGVTVIQKAPERVWIKSTKMDSTLGKSLLEVDKKLAYVGGQRTGFTTAINLRYTFSGRKMLEQAKATSLKENAMPKKTAQQFLDDPLSSVENPIIIHNKNVIEVPIKKSDESIFHIRKTDSDSPAVKVGSVQEYYKTATSSFINVPKQGLRLPKAPTLPSFNSARNWIAKTKSNVKMVEQKGYGAMLSGGKVKLKIVSKSQKVKDNILDAKKIAKAEAEGKIRDAKLLAKGKQYQAEKQIDEMVQAGKKKLDPLSNQARQNNAWGKLSKFKAESKIKIGEVKKSITNRGGTEELILYREVTTTTASKSIARSTTEPLTISGTPIKTSITHTKTPTDYTTTYGKVIDEKMTARGFTNPDGSPIMKMGYTNVEGSLFKLKKVDPNLTIVGEQVRIPFKDKKIIESLSDANLNRMYQQGKYNVLEKGKLVEKKVEVKALQQEDVDKTFQQRNAKFEISKSDAVTTWDGIQSDTSFRNPIQYKVLTTKLSPLPKKNPPSKVIHKSMTQNDSGAVFTAESVTGNPMTGKTGGYGKIPDEVHSKMSSDGTVSVSINKISSAPVKGQAKIVMKDYSSTWKATKSPYNSAYVGSAVGEITFTSSVLTPKGMIKTGVDTNTSSITGVQSKIDTKVSTGLKQDSIQRLNTDTASRLKTRTGLKSKLNTKLDTGLKAKQMTATMPLLKSQALKTTHKKAVVLPIILPREELKVKTRRGKRGKKAGFIGNVRLDNIMGMYKRKEITYGKRKVSKLERQDARLTAKTSNRISTPASGLLKSKKKKKKKTESILGRTVTKTKDEFSGFALSKTKPVKRKKSKRITL